VFAGFIRLEWNTENLENGPLFLHWHDFQATPETLPARGRSSCGTGSTIKITPAAAKRLVLVLRALVRSARLKKIRLPRTATGLLRQALNSAPIEIVGGWAATTFVEDGESGTGAQGERAGGPPLRANSREHDE